MVIGVHRDSCGSHARARRGLTRGKGYWITPVQGAGSAAVLFDRTNLTCLAVWRA
jgi:hypothetical protein